MSKSKLIAKAISKVLKSAGNSDPLFKARQYARSLLPKRSIQEIRDKNSKEYEYLLSTLGDKYDTPILRALEGRDIYRDWIKGPVAQERASKWMPKEDAELLANYESKLLDFIKYPSYKNGKIKDPNFEEGPLRLKFGKIVDNASAISDIKSDGSRLMNVDLDKSSNIIHSIIHESGHSSTLNYNRFDPDQKFLPTATDKIQPLLEKQMENAKRLADQLEVDPDKYQRVYRALIRRGHSPEDAKDKIAKHISYLKLPQEARARGINANIWMEDYLPHDAFDLIPANVDNGTLFFTDKSLKNLYKGVWGVGAPTVIGTSLYGTQD